MLDLGVMFGQIFKIARSVVLNCVQERPIFFNHPELNEMVRELLPLQGAVVIYVDLFKQLDQVLCEDGRVFVVREVL